MVPIYLITIYPMGVLIMGVCLVSLYWKVVTMRVLYLDMFSTGLLIMDMLGVGISRKRRDLTAVRGADSPIV